MEDRGWRKSGSLFDPRSSILDLRCFLPKEHGKEVAIPLFGQEINVETYAFSKANLLVKREGEEAENFKHASTLSLDAFPSRASSP